MKKYAVYVNKTFQGCYMAFDPNMAISMYVVDYQTTRGEIARLFNTHPVAMLYQ